MISDPMRPERAEASPPGRFETRDGRRAWAVGRARGSRLPSLRGLAAIAWAAGVLALSARAGDPAALAARSLLLGSQTVGTTTFAVGAYGDILRSTDDGRSWQLATAPTAVTLTDVSFPDAQHGWAVGHDALILHSEDGGLTWTKQYQGPNLDAPLLGVLFLDRATGFAVGAYGQFVATVDGGRTWTPRSILSEDRHLNRITAGPTGTLYIAGEQGTLLRSHDRGATWQEIDSPYDGSFYGILPLSDKVLVAYGLRGRIYRSENDGAEWTHVPTAARVLLATAVRLRNGVIVVAGQARAFFVSRDDGRTFTPWSTPMTTPVASLVETAGGQLLALGEVGLTPLPPP